MRLKNKWQLKSKIIHYFLDRLIDGVIVKEIKLPTDYFKLMFPYRNAKHCYMPVYVENKTYKLVLTNKDLT